MTQCDNNSRKRCMSTIRMSFCPFIAMYAHLFQNIDEIRGIGGHREGQVHRGGCEDADPGKNQYLKLYLGPRHSKSPQ